MALIILYVTGAAIVWGFYAWLHTKSGEKWLKGL